jgi:TolA-binding protein
MVFPPLCLLSACTAGKQPKAATATEKAPSLAASQPDPAGAQRNGADKLAGASEPSADESKFPLSEEVVEAVTKPSPADGSKHPAAAKVEAALQERKARHYDEAFKELRAALDLSPPPALTAEIWFTIGETEFLKGQNAKEGRISGVEPEGCYLNAAKTLSDLIQRYPREAKTAEGAYLLGSSYLLLEDMEKALEAYQHAFNDYPGSPQRAGALLRIGICQASLDEPLKAQEIFSRVVREFPDKKAETSKARKYLEEIRVVGKRAPQLGTSEWLFGNVGKEGIGTFDGEVLALIFFATWCENCSHELPHVRALIKRWSPMGITFLGVANPDDPKNTLPVDVYVKKNNVEFLDVALDRKSSCWFSYNVSGLPAGVLIDRKGIVRWRGHPAFFPRPLAEKILKER